MLLNGKKCEKIKSNENLMATIPTRNYDRTKRTGECAIFQLFEQYKNK